MENQTNKSVQPINHFHKRTTRTRINFNPATAKKNKYEERGNTETVVYQIACQLRST